MARSLDDIQRDIDNTRKQLAGTLDKLAEATRPANLVNDAKSQATQQLKNPKVQAVVAGVAGVIGLAVVLSVSSARRRRRELNELREILASR